MMENEEKFNIITYLRDPFLAQKEATVYNKKKSAKDFGRNPRGFSYLPVIALLKTYEIV